VNERISRNWMWAEACALLEEAERRHRRFFELLSIPARQPAWEPPADVFSNHDELTIVIALPGARPESVTVLVHDDVLVVEAQVPPPALALDSRIVRLELPYGVFRRQVPLPAGRFALAERGLRDGCLHLRLMAVHA
jgi:HSP20 family protein